jgi:hypothetical protein
MKLKNWEKNICKTFDSSLETESRDSYDRIPSNDSKRSVPSVTAVVTNQTSFIKHRIKEDETKADIKYEAYIKEYEYGTKIVCGDNLDSIEQAKFITDIKLIDLGYDIEHPFLIEEKKELAAKPHIDRFLANDPIDW